MNVAHKKGFVAFFLTLIIVSVVILVIIFFKPNTNDPLEVIGIIMSSILGVLSLFFVIKEYRRARNIEEGQFIFNLNQAFIGSEDLKDIYIKIYLESKDPSLKLIGEKDITKIVSYLTFLETFWTMYTRGIISIKMIDDLFANRFFLMITNPRVQSLKLVREYSVYQNVRELEYVWRQYRLKNNLKNLYEENSLNKAIAIKVAQDKFFENKANEPYTFQRLSTKHLDQIIALQNEVILGLENEALLLRTPKDTFEEIIRNESNISLGVFMDDVLIAYCFFTFPKVKESKTYQKRFLLPWLHRRNMYFKVVVVQEQHRNRGIQSAFLKAAKEYASYYKIKRIIATVHPDNKISCKVFEKSQFSLIKTTPVHNNTIRNIYEYKLKKYIRAS
ncbi:MAG: GNAT family N-acetyltransferase [Candidatus Izemoplasmatales bacterium]|nr:GNAT family N-acetyltransferase [Candidatus Izemoplasmatales bacterium]MDD4355393.1 GNAT family N-acetyltransferase [Candidatus Izemoplasmatales bacterium]